jgi:mRNA interferase RelE/StbE
LKKQKLTTELWINLSEIRIPKKVSKELAQIPSVQRKEIERFVFDELSSLNSVAESGKCQKMQGYEGFYKIRFGDYRVGLKVEGNTIIFERALHRKDIYRYFP